MTIEEKKEYREKRDEPYQTATDEVLLMFAKRGFTVSEARDVLRRVEDEFNQTLLSSLFGGQIPSDYDAVSSAVD